MEPILRIAAAGLRLSGLPHTIAELRRRIVLLTAVAIVALIAATAMLAWFSIALYLYCATRIGEPLAAVVAAGAFMIIVLIALLVAALSRPAKPAPAPAPRADALADLERVLRANKNLLLLAAVVAGLVLGKTRPRSSD